MAKASPGDVLVVDVGGLYEAGYWGEIMTVAAQARGIAGLVIDGSVRDADRIEALGFPVFARGARAIIEDSRPYRSREAGLIATHNGCSGKVNCDLQLTLMASSRLRLLGML